MYVTGSYSFSDIVIYGIEQCLESSLHLLFMVFVTQVMKCELISKQLAKTLTFSNGKNLRSEGACRALGVFHPSFSTKNFEIAQTVEVIKKR